jgi:hypothetical protein
LDFSTKLVLKLTKTIPLLQEALFVTLTKLWLIFGSVFELWTATVDYSILLSTEREYRLDTSYNLEL